MEISEIIENSFKYPLNDFKRLLILGIPTLIIALFALVLSFQGLELSSIADSSKNAILSSPIFSTFMVTFLLFIVVAFVCMIIMQGIGISVIRETIKSSDELPNIDFKMNLIDGLKSLIVSLVYVGIPMIIFFILLFGVIAALGKNSGFLVILLYIIFLIVFVFIGLFLTVSQCRLAETNSLGEALSFSNIIEIGKKIGLVKIFAVTFIVSIILQILAMIGTLLSMLPIIGIFITAYVFTYMIIVNHRAIGLLYLDKNIENYQQNNNQTAYPTMDYNQIPGTDNNQIPELNNNNEMQTPDFNPNNIQINENIQANNNNIPHNPKCSKCGYTNPDFVNICVNCGNELK